MSTHWDIICKEHGAEAGFRLNHGQYRLSEVACGIRRFRDGSLKPLFLVLDDMVGYRSRGEMPWLADLAEFLESHAGCALRLRNEYGGHEDRCQGSFVGEDGHWQSCVLAVGHDGDHSARKRADER